ncbi:MAG: amidohydrolase family protein, partial [Pseudomonadota bacterium]
APHSTEVVGDDTFHALRTLADQLDRRVQIHLHESAAEVDRAIASTGERPMARLARLGFLNGSLLAVHAVHLLDEEISQMADAGVSVAHCPRSNLKLASGMARVQAMQAAGVNVALGTDGAASNNELDILGELRVAALLAKGVANDPGALRAHDALRMVTLDGARALGLHDEIGSIEPDKAADLVCIDVSGVRSQPLYDPVSQVVYTCAADQVSDVWVAGRQLIDKGEVSIVDEQEVIARSQEWQQRISAT